jgi:GT2 family glycosyltransferase
MTGDAVAGLPGVTVVMTCFNQGRWVEQALASVARQTLLPHQLIVADDASTDDSTARIERWLAANWPDATFVRHRTNTGLPAMLNEVVALADQELIVLAAADDEMRADRLEREARVLATASPEVALVYADMDLMDEAGVDLGMRYTDYGPMPVEGDAFAAMLRASVPASPTVMLRRAALVEAGPFDESLVFEDWDMWLRLSRQVHFAFIPEPLVRYRRVHGSLSRSDAYRATFGEASIRVLRKHIGVSPATDRIIAERLGCIALDLYRKGYAPASAARELRFAVCRHPTGRSCAGLALATLRIPGPSVVAAAARVRRPWRRPAR